METQKFKAEVTLSSSRSGTVCGLIGQERASLAKGGLGVWPSKPGKVLPHRASVHRGAAGGQSLLFVVDGGGLGRTLTLTSGGAGD